VSDSSNHDIILLCEFMAKEHFCKPVALSAGGIEWNKGALVIDNVARGLLIVLQ